MIQEHFACYIKSLSILHTKILVNDIDNLFSLQDPERQVQDRLFFNFNE
jgi:hypothetical protein